MRERRGQPIGWVDLTAASLDGTTLTLERRGGSAAGQGLSDLTVDLSSLGGGSDWTYVTQVGTDSTASTTVNEDTELTFTPSSSTTYLVEFFGLWGATVANETPKIGLELSDDLDDGTGYTEVSNAGTGTPGRRSLGDLGDSIPLLAQSNGTAGSTAFSYPFEGKYTLLTGASSTTAMTVVFRATDGNGSIEIYPGSYLRYREL